jgi:glycosyltransferase involved in cell wall biosynthesis
MSELQIIEAMKAENMAAAKAEPSSRDHTAHSPQPAAYYLFIVPGRLDRLTGGSVYDKRLNDYLKERGARVDVISLPDLPYFAGLILGIIISPLLALRTAGRGYDLIIEDGWAHPSLVFFNLLCRARSGLKIVIIAHQLRWPESQCRAASAIARLVERAALKASRLIVTVSDFMRREIEELIGTEPRILIACPGSDPKRDACAGESNSQEDLMARSALPSLERARVRLLFVGNCTRRKGLHHLIAALSILRHPLVKLNVVGDCDFDPAYTKELESEVARLGLRNEVTFHGQVSDERLSRFYSQSDLFVMPSSYEGFGIVYAEAMRAGLPVIASDTGPAAEIVSAGANALLVPPDNPRALADAIGTLASDAELRALYGRRSLELARQLPTWDVTCDLILKSLSDLIGPQKSFE